MDHRSVELHPANARQRLFTQLAAYVEAVAGDDEKLVQSAAMDVRAAAVVSSDTPAQPAALTVTAGDHDGELDLTWDKIVGSKSYVMEKSPDPPTPTSWTHAGVSTTFRATISGLAAAHATGFA